MKRIISFSLWGNIPMHCGGAIENIKLAKELYPDWICRFYIDDTVPQMIADNISKEGGEISVVKEKLGSFYGMFWRFFANDDPEVERFLSRDCDSRLSIREKAAVDEWMASGKTLHTMHDHYFHTGVPILGGMWGIKTGVIKDMREMVLKWPTHNKKGCDQQFLSYMIWPKLKNDVLRHDNGYQMQYGPANRFPKHPPMKFGGTFIGEIFDENNISMNPVPWEDSRMKR